LLLFRRHTLLPWLWSAITMFALSFLWHGVILKDLQELKIPLTLYLVLSGIVYLLLGLTITVATHKAIEHEWVSLKGPFPLMVFLIGAAIGFVVYLLIFVLGMSFAKNEVVHIVVDILWQMVEQGLGGFVVSLGLIYDMRQRFLEEERGH
jgi:hypothetical protein